VHETVASQSICRAYARDAGKTNSYQLPGLAWLEFEARPEVDGKTMLLQTAFYEPKGLLGFLYWYALYPMHGVIFSGLIRKVAQ